MQTINANPFDQTQIIELKEAFDLIDVNHDGVISKNDLAEVLFSFGIYCLVYKILELNSSIFSAESMMREASNENGINFNQFLTMFEKQSISKTASEQMLLRSFELVDKNNTGFVLESDFSDMMTCGDNSLTSEQVPLIFEFTFQYVELMNAIDVKDSGKIDYRKFVSTLLLGGV